MLNFYSWEQNKSEQDVYETHPPTSLKHPILILLNQRDKVMTQQHYTTKPETRNPKPETLNWPHWDWGWHPPASEDRGCGSAEGMFRRWRGARACRGFDTLFLAAPGGPRGTTVQKCEVLTQREKKKPALRPSLLVKVCEHWLKSIQMHGLWWNCWEWDIYVSSLRNLNFSLQEKVNKVISFLHFPPLHVAIPVTPIAW